MNVRPDPQGLHTTGPADGGKRISIRPADAAVGHADVSGPLHPFNAPSATNQEHGGLK